MRFTATAEHCGGGSVGHPCRKGVFSDPTDSWQEDVTAASLKEAEQAAHSALARIVEDSERCDCERQRQAGSNDWWNSVTIQLWPQDAESLTAYVAEYGELGDDPYGLVPDSLKPALSDDEE